MNNNIVIYSKGSFTTPAYVQQSIRQMLANSANKEVFVKHDNKDNTYYAYQKNEGGNNILVGYFDELGNEI